jgi:hypothetical protein
MRRPLSLFMALVAVVVLLASGLSRESGEEMAAAKPIDLCVASGETPMGRGCCSWHGGECGCQNGRDVCCDGTLSPTCTCHN